MHIVGRCSFKIPVQTSILLLKGGREGDGIKVRIYSFRKEMLYSFAPHVVVQGNNTDVCHSQCTLI